MTHLRDAARAMRAHPGFTAAAVLMLALGIGINVAVFSITKSVLFKGFRLVENNDRILYIGTQKDGRGCCAWCGLSLCRSEMCATSGSRSAAWRLA